MNNEFTISPLGDAAVLISFGNIIDESINKNVLSIFETIKNFSLPYVTDIVPAYSSLAVYYDVADIYERKNSTESVFNFVSEEMNRIIKKNKAPDLINSRKIKVPVCYSQKYALDIDEISLQKKLTREEIIHLHTSKKYRVYMIGFLPGFPYMGEVDERIAVSRKSAPRTMIEAGSVGIAGRQTGIYSLNSPGGWQIIGKTPMKIFDKQNDDPVLFQPGDEVEFFSITEDEFTNY